MLKKKIKSLKNNIVKNSDDLSEKEILLNVFNKWEDDKSTDEIIRVVKETREKSLMDNQ